MLIVSDDSCVEITETVDLNASGPLIIFGKGVTPATPDSTLVLAVTRVLQGAIPEGRSFSRRQDLHADLSYRPHRVA